MNDSQGMLDKEGKKIPLGQTGSTFTQQERSNGCQPPVFWATEVLSVPRGSQCKNLLKSYAGYV